MAFIKSLAHTITGSFIICAALLGACSGDDGPDGTVVPLDFCTPPDWVAIKDGSGPWQHILPVEGVYEATFETAKAGLAWANGPDVSLAGVSVQYGLPSELAVHCFQGTAQVNGTATLTAESQRIEVGLANSHAFVSGVPGVTSFALPFVLEGSWNLFALRVDDIQPDPAPTKVIIRRGIDVPQAGNLALLDFEGAEAFTLAAAQVTVTGVGAATGGRVVSSYYDSDGYMSDIAGSDLSMAGSSVYSAVPLEQLAAGELSVLAAVATDNLGLRLAYQFFRAPADMSVAMGPVLNRPEVTFPNTSPYLRPLARLASQVEYGQLAQAEFRQDNHHASVEVSSAYLGGTPATWQLELPDFSGVEGWDNAWGLDPSAAVRWSVVAQAGAVPWAQAPRQEGDKFLFASQGSEEASINAELITLRAGSR